MKFFRQFLIVLLAAVWISGCNQPDKAAPKPAAARTLSQTTAELPHEALVSLDKLEPPVIFEPLKKTLPAPQGVQDECDNLVKKGQELQAQRQFSDAVSVLQRALTLNPEDPALMKHLGMCYLAEKKLDRAADFLQQAVGYNPDDLDLQVNLGRVYMLQNKSQLAIYCFRSALKTKQATPSDPQTAFALLYLARLLEQDGYYTAALECYDRLEGWIEKYWDDYGKNKMLADLALKPERFMIARGRLYEKLNMFPQSLAQFKRAYSRDRADVKVGAKYFELLLKTGDYKSAENLVISFARQPSYEDVVGKMAQKLCEVSGDSQMPMRIWKRYRNKDQILPGLALSLASAATKLGAYAEAEEILKLVLREMPDCPEAATMLTMLKIRQNQTGKALEQAVKIIEDNPGARDSINVAVDAIADCPEGKELLDGLLKSIAAGGPAVESRMYVAAVMSKKLGGEKQCDKLLLDAIGKNPKFVPAYLELLQQRWVLANPQQTDKLLAQMHSEADGPRYYQLLGSVQMIRGETSAAIESLSKAREGEPENATVLVTLSDAYQREAKKAGASSQGQQMRQISEDLLIEAIDARPGDPRAYRELFNDYINRKQVRNAAVVAARFIKNIPDSPEGTIMAADTYIIEGDRAKAGILVEKLRKENPDNRYVRLLEVRWELSGYRGVLPKQVFDDSRSRLETLVNAKELFPQALAMLGGLLTRPVPGDYDAAADVYRSIYELDVNNPETATEYARAMIRAKQCDKAEKFITDVRKKSPDDFVLKRLLAEAYIGKKDYAQAEEYLKHWIEADGGLAKKLFSQMLLRLYCQQNQTDKALSLLDDMQNISGAKKDEIAREKLVVMLDAKRYDDAIAYADQFGEKLYLGIVIDQLLLAGGDENFDKAENIVKKKLAAAKDEQDRKYWQFQELNVLAARGGKSMDEFKTLAGEMMTANPTNYDMWKMIYYTLMRWERTDPAMSYLDEWRKKFYGSEVFGDAEKKFMRWCRDNLIKMLIAQCKYVEANNLLDQFMAEDGGTADYCYLRSSVYNELGQEQRALEYMKQAMNLDNANASFMNDMAYQLAVAGEDLDTAEKLSRQCIQKLGFEPAYIDTLAWVLYKKGEFSRAAELMLQIVPSPSEIGSFTPCEKSSHTDDHPTLLDHAGDVLYRLGWKKLAGEYWKAALDAAKLCKYKDRELKLVLDSVPAKLKAIGAQKEAAASPVGNSTKKVEQKGTGN